MIAVDRLPEFIRELDTKLASARLGGRISALVAAMEALPFAPQSFDAIWSEGAIYNMGFASGIRAWRHLIKPNGVLAVSELTWLTDKRPVELERHWTEAYPEVGTASEKIAVLEENGFSPLGYFPLPPHCWLANYYRPMESRFSAFLARNAKVPSAAAIVEAERDEISLYERYSDYVGYGFYVAKRTAD